MSELKTKPTKLSVSKYISSIEDKEKRDDAKKLLELFKEVTKEKPVMWGDSIVGFGKYHYKSKSGREGDWMKTGFSARKNNLSLYIISGFKDNKDLIKKLGPNKTSVGCLYIKKLSDVDLSVLKKIVKEDWKSEVKVC